jgi:NitT/TauT family transport system substrate-binding protein
MRKLFVSLIALSLVLQLFGQLHRLTFTPHWLPQAQFAGYYTALEKGFYKDEGLDVTIVHPSASVNAVEKLEKGESDIISLFLVTAISAKYKDIDIVNIAQLSQNSALLFVTRKDKNIRNLSDLNGKKIGVWYSGFDEVGKALAKANKLDVQWVPILSSINLFMVGGIDAMTVMWYNEYQQIINSGINHDELDKFFFSEYGFNVPEDGLYCLNSTYNLRKNDLEKFVKATLRGWDYARNNRVEAVELVMRIMKQENIPTNKTHQSWMLDKVLELMKPSSGEQHIGELSRTDFDKAQNILIDGGYIYKQIDF